MALDLIILLIMSESFVRYVLINPGQNFYLSTYPTDILIECSSRHIHTIFLHIFTSRHLKVAIYFLFRLVILPDINWFVWGIP